MDRSITYQDHYTHEIASRDQRTSRNLMCGNGGGGPSSLHTTFEGPTKLVNARWMYKVTWIPTCHEMDHISRLLGLYLENHLLKVGLSQNRKTMALQKVTSVDLLYSIMFEDPILIKVRGNSI